MTNSIFTPINVSLNEDIHEFSTDNKNEKILIDADTTLYDEIELSYRIQYNKSGMFYKTVLYLSDAEGNLIQNHNNILYLPVINYYVHFDVYYPQKKEHAQHVLNFK